MKDINNESFEILCEALTLLDKKEDVKLFLEDLCTIKEIQDMAQRFNTAILLEKGVNYNTISNEIGTSAATISRVSRCLNYGDGGYKTVLDKLKENKNGNQ